MGGVFNVQALLRGFLGTGGLDKVRVAAAHSFAGVFRICEDIGAVGAKSKAYGHDEYGGAYDHIAALLLLDVENKLHNPHQGYEHKVIVEHLGMLGGSSGHENHCEDGSQDVFFLAEYKVEAAQDNCGGGNRHCLCEMPGANYDKEVGRQAYGYGSGNAQPFVHVKAAKAYEEAQEVEENDPGGALGPVYE